MIGTSEQAGAEGDRRERRRAAMVAAARALFLERGYDAVSLAEIVRRSGGSLTTLYELFENKPGLLGAVIEDERFGGLERLRAIVQRDLPPATALHAIASELNEEFTDPRTIGLMRIVMAEALRDASFVARIHAILHEPLVAAIAPLFSRWHAEGRARIPDAEFAVHLFLSLVLHGTQMRALLGDDSTLCPFSSKQEVSGAVDFFIAGVGIDPAR